MNINRLPVKNLLRKSGRTTALLILVILLSVSMMGGTLTVTSLQSGLASLETRLGADIIVVPDEAKSKKDLESILLDGVPGYFYMDRA
ncbi:MAG: ABC transporter permease, partial [Firmicutes bacterium]|nr:ABC transporter permease [Bacillota bacterium]